MKLYFLALILEFFVDYVPADAPFDQYPYISELRAVMKEKGVEIQPWVKGAENIWMFWNLGRRVKESDFSHMPPEKLILFAWEPPTVQKELYDPTITSHFGKIFTWDDDLVDNKRFFKLHYPALRPKMSDIPPFEEKKFCTMIARRLSSSNVKQLYIEREKTIRFFEDKPGEFDLYGQYWEKRKYKNWRGPVVDKMAVLKNYKYSICYENTKDVKGYISEKIFDCFAAGVVPVYWGASNVADYIPANCFIDRRQFKDDKALYRYLRKITKQEYEQYIKNAEAFLASPQAQLFSSEHFLDTFRLIFN